MPIAAGAPELQPYAARPSGSVVSMKFGYAALMAALDSTRGRTSPLMNREYASLTVSYSPLRSLPGGTNTQTSGGMRLVGDGSPYRFSPAVTISGKPVAGALPS